MPHMEIDIMGWPAQAYRCNKSDPSLHNVDFYEEYKAAKLRQMQRREWISFHRKWRMRMQHARNWQHEKRPLQRSNNWQKQESWQMNWNQHMLMLWLNIGWEQGKQKWLKMLKQLTKESKLTNKLRGWKLDGTPSCVLLSKIIKKSERDRGRGRGSLLHA